MLLDYQFSSDPTPLQASTGSAPAQGVVDVFVAPPSGKQVWCTEITIAIPYGNGPTDPFVGDRPVVSVSTDAWSLTDVMEMRGGGDNLGEVGVNYLQAVAKPRDPSYDEITYPLAFGVSGTVTTTPGPFPIAIREVTSPDGVTYSTLVATYPLSTSTPQFYLRNFMTTSAATPTVPVTEFPNGGPITFEWESNGTWFALYEGGSLSPVYQGTATTFTLASGITSPKTFVLVASATGSPDGTPNDGFQAIYLYEAVSLSVVGADVSVNLLDAGVVTAGQVTVSGSTSLQGATVQDLTATTLTSGATTMAGANVQQSMRVAGGVTTPTIASLSGGSPILMDDNGHQWLIKWVGQEGNDLVAQIFMWDNAQRWGGLRLPILDYKTFIIPHPVDAERYLVHATLEGPEAGVFYRGTATLRAGRAEVALPPYADALCDPESWTFQLTPVGCFDRLAVVPMGEQRVTDGRFVVASEDPESEGTFDWEAKATRRDQAPLDVEPRQADLDVRGIGPYTFGVPTPVG